MLKAGARPLILMGRVSRGDAAWTTRIALAAHVITDHNTRSFPDCPGISQATRKPAQLQPDCGMDMLGLYPEPP